MNGDPPSGGSGSWFEEARQLAAVGSDSARTPPRDTQPLLWNLQQALSGWGYEAVQVATSVAATWPVTGTTLQARVGGVAPRLRRAMVV